ncbi:RMD1 family protein [Leptolyngbya sp. AN02str]|uniref:RMD1 family protein n=1 Tax=Leptolyngbya sp. AN02str TaxID=3423363 RepID=UPI003D3172CB
MENLLFVDKSAVRVRAMFLGECLDCGTLENTNVLAREPIVVPAGENGCAVLFGYGAAVLFGLEPIEEASFLSYLKPLIIEPFDTPETEEATLKLDPVGAGQVDNGIIRLQEFTLERLQIVADVLAKSVVLAQYESGTANVFDQIEPFAASLQRTTKNDRAGKELLRQLGTTVAIQHKIVGRVEIIDKPELLWDSPTLERLYQRLENEYEIRERHTALERKLGLISNTAETVLDLLQHNSSLRVEWYVVVLIVVEIMLSVYDIVLSSR